MEQQRTRREVLQILGAASASVLAGCGGSSLTESHAQRGGDGAGGAAPDGGGIASAGGASGGAAGLPADGGAGAPTCAPKQEETVGPYPSVDALARRDVRGNTTGVTTPKDGAMLLLRVRVRDLDAGCGPIPGAVVDVWQCDATGVYAGYAAFSTTGQDFCRGYQMTDATGVAEFVTIFPGSYAGRALHIHFSIQGAPSNLRPSEEGAALPGIFVGQLYFDRAVADEIFGSVPVYQQGAPITPNGSDGIFVSEGGAGLIAKVTKTGSSYIAEVDVPVTRSAIGK